MAWISKTSVPTFVPGGSVIVDCNARLNQSGYFQDKVEETFESLDHSRLALNRAVGQGVDNFVEASSKYGALGGEVAAAFAHYVSWLGFPSAPEFALSFPNGSYQHPDPQIEAARPSPRASRQAQSRGEVYVHADGKPGIMGSVESPTIIVEVQGFLTLGSVLPERFSFNSARWIREISGTTLTPNVLIEDRLNFDSFEDSPDPAQLRGAVSLLPGQLGLADGYTLHALPTERLLGRLFVLLTATVSLPLESEEARDMLIVEKGKVCLPFGSEPLEGMTVATFPPPGTVLASGRLLPLPDDNDKIDVINRSKNFMHQKARRPKARPSRTAPKLGR